MITNIIFLDENLGFEMLSLPYEHDSKFIFDN